MKQQVLSSGTLTPDHYMLHSHTESLCIFPELLLANWFGKQDI